MVTGLYAGLLALWLVVPSTRVIAPRGNPVFGWFAFGANDEDGLNRAIRAQGNLTEYAPIFLLLMMLAEMAGLAARVWAGPGRRAGHAWHLLWIHVAEHVPAGWRDDAHAVPHSGAGGAVTGPLCRLRMSMS